VLEPVDGLHQYLAALRQRESALSYRLVRLATATLTARLLWTAAGLAVIALGLTRL